MCWYVYKWHYTSETIGDSMQISATRLCVILSSQFSNSAQLSALSGGGGGGGGEEGG